jgi:hypothetical protein
MLIDAIKTHALTEAQSGDWSAVAAILNAPTVEVRNPKSWTMADLIGLVGAQSAATVGGTIQAAGANSPIFAGAWIALNVTGLQLHTAERQAMIDGLAAAGSWPDQLRDTVKAAGLTYTSLSDATAEQCQAAWDTDQLSQIWTTALNDGGINQALAVGDHAALRSALTTLLESL